jgi:hypothetical protein
VQVKRNLPGRLRSHIGHIPPSRRVIIMTQETWQM